MSPLAWYALYSLVLSGALAVNGFRRSRAGVSTLVPGASPIRRVLIIGATGGTGRQLVEQALARGLQVTAFARTPSKITVKHPQLTVVQGDVLDAASVDAAMRDQDAVLCALGHARFFGPSRILSDGTANLITAMKTHGARRLICETTMGIGDSAFRLGPMYTFFIIPLILPFYFWDKTRQEQRIAASGLEWVLVRPVALTNGTAKGGVRHGTAPGSVVWTQRISRAGVAAFMLDQLTSDAYLGGAPGIAQ